MRTIWLLLTISCIVCGYALVAGGPWILLSPFLGGPLAIAGFIAAILHLQRLRRTRTEPKQAIPRKAILALVVAFVIFVLQPVLLLGVMGALRDSSKTTVTSANLRGIGQAIIIYCDDHGAYPDSFDTLVAENITSPKQFISIGDHRTLRGEWDPDAGLYSSFIYTPGEGPCREEPQIILAYERQPWSPLEVRLFPKRGRWTLFGDANVRLLGETEFAAAQEEDKRRRTELGWPTE